MTALPGPDALWQAAAQARMAAYAPYSRFAVGAALLFADGAVVTGANVENASYGLSLCAETVAAANALSRGRRDGLLGIAVAGGPADQAPGAITPCGRCRQVLFELASLSASDPWVIGAPGTAPVALSVLLPCAFGPAALAGDGAVRGCP